MPKLFSRDWRLKDVDMRSRRGRRYKATAAAVIAEHGLLHPTALRELVALKFIVDEARDQAISGDQRARQDWLKLSDLVARRESQIREAIRTPAHAA
jgi:hypothetical protein